MKLTFEMELSSLKSYTLLAVKYVLNIIPFSSPSGTPSVKKVLQYVTQVCQKTGPIWIISQRTNLVKFANQLVKYIKELVKLGN